MPKSNKKILICYNEPIGKYENYIGKLTDGDRKIDLSEVGFIEQIDLIVTSLKKYYSNVETLAITRNIKKNLISIKKHAPDLIFNFVESIDGAAQFEAFVAGIFELVGYNFTGSKMLCLANCLDKNRAKQLLLQNGISTPNFFLIDISKNLDLSKLNLNFPIILKLSAEDASIGISENSVVYSIAELKKQISFLKKHYNQNIIAEEFINGREFNISIIGNTVLPISEIDYSGLNNSLPKLVTYEAKWDSDSLYYNHTVPICPTKLSNKLKKKISDVALKAFNILKCRDYARVDIRLDGKENIFVIEVNPNPDISEDSGFVRSAKQAGLTYSKLLYQITRLARKRI